MSKDSSNPHSDDSQRDASRESEPQDSGTPGGSLPGAEDQPWGEMSAEQEQLITQLRADLDEVRDRALRAQAELENFRKRVYRQMEEERKFAALPILRDLLPVIDNLQRALAAAEQSGNGGPLLEGVRLINQQMMSLMAAHHCTAIDPKGTLFDPHFHEAIAQLPSSEVPRGSVLEVTQTGYQLHDRVVRPAQVLVSAGPAGAPP